MGERAFLVGGLVRDLAVGRSNTDLDIVIEGDALALAGAFARSTGSLVKSRTRFGTCKIVSRAFGTIDLATARSESYRCPGALPDTEASDLHADLARRDFTMNAMAISLDPEGYGQILDPFDGLSAIGEGKLEILHPASFRDDPTRILRGVRFAARFGFTFERVTLARLRDCLREAWIDSVSGKRIFTELRLICLEDEVLKALRLLGKLGILEAVAPALGRDALRSRRMRRMARAVAAVRVSAGEAFAEDWLCWLGTLFAGLGRRQAVKLAGRLDLPGRVAETCVWISTGLSGTLAKLSRLTPKDAYRAVKLLRGLSPEEMVHLFAAAGWRERRLITAYLETWRHISPSLDGRRVVALGIDEGPAVGRILGKLLELRLQGKVTSPEDETAYVKRRVRSRR
jgi:tRNA nucleotidyltransferase (CCA-adding enzyme)